MLQRGCHEEGGTLHHLKAVVRFLTRPTHEYILSTLTIEVPTFDL